MRRVADGAAVDKALWRDLTYGWGNTGFSPGQRYLQAVLDASSTANGAILECGSGLTTLVLATVTGKRDVPVWTLEHDPAWAAHVDAALRRSRLNGKVILAPLVDYGDFAWYDVSRLELPTQFDLVICDGPPGTTSGGRFGLLPVAAERLKPGCTILLDDAERASEAATLARWSEEFGLSCDVHESDEEVYASCVVGLATATTSP
jgi:predicted O-methyltransferase YrrM